MQELLLYAGMGTLALMSTGFGVGQLRNWSTYAGVAFFKKDDYEEVVCAE